MAPKRSKAGKKKGKKSDQPTDWRMHDLYNPGVSYNRIVTRSQTAFTRLKGTNSELDLFADPTRHQPPGQPHVMQVLKGKYGALPRTIITRSTARYLSPSEELNRMLDIYKTYAPSVTDEPGFSSAKEASDNDDPFLTTSDEQ